MLETIKSALMQLVGNKLRTFLTMLGMLIGVGSVIMILSLGEGMKTYMNEQYEGMGKGTLQVSVSGYNQSENVLLSQSDVEMLESIPEVKEVYKYHNGYWGSSTDAHKQGREVIMHGYPHNIENIKSMHLEYGRMFNEQDEEARNHVIIVEDNFAKIMLGQSNPEYALGKKVDIMLGDQTGSFEVIGVVKSQYPSGADESTIWPNIYFPFTTLDQYIMDGEGKTYTLYVQIDSHYEEKNYIKPIERILNKQHGNKEIYTVSAMNQESEEMNQMINTQNIFLGAIAAISLVVGGIGIMNIMLVTVKERTKEIGIRKALGASRGQILSQFLVEAIILTLLGGLCGMLVGYLGGCGLASLMGMETTLTASMIIFSVGTSSIIGLVFGVYPANKAAKLEPVEALREE